MTKEIIDGYIATVLDMLQACVETNDKLSGQEIVQNERRYSPNRRLERVCTKKKSMYKKRLCNRGPWKRVLEETPRNATREGTKRCTP